MCGRFPSSLLGDNQGTLKYVAKLGSKQNGRKSLDNFAHFKSSSLIHRQNFIFPLMNSSEPNIGTTILAWSGLFRMNSWASSGDKPRWPPSTGLLPFISNGNWDNGLEEAETTTWVFGTKYGPIFWTRLDRTLLSGSSSYRIDLAGVLRKPTITTVTPALWAAKFAHLNEGAYILN